MQVYRAKNIPPLRFEFKTHRVLYIRRMVALSAQWSHRFAAAIGYETPVAEDICVFGPIAHEPILESQSSAALELKHQV